jgi:hypothetical protein
MLAIKIIKGSQQVSPVVQKEKIHCSAQAVGKSFCKGPQPIPEYFKRGVSHLGTANSH